MVGNFKISKFQNEHCMFAQACILDEIRLAVVDFSYIESFVVFHAGSNCTNEVPRSIMAFFEYRIFSENVPLTQTD